MSDLSIQDKKEKQRILSSGFDWSQEEFDKFTKCLLKLEKKDYKNIQLYDESKTIEEIQQYSEVFWRKK